MELRVEIDERSGFCFGVVTAISKAEESIAGGQEVYSLGDIVHNRVEVQRLEEMGLRTIRHDSLDELRDSTVLIRAHGEPPSTYEKAKKNALNIIDATCPVVARLQEQVVNAWEMMKPVGGQVVILGKKGHAEVVGLAGQVDGEVVIIEGVEDIGAIDLVRPVYMLSQTTQSLALFDRVKKEIIARAEDPATVTVHDTVCRQVANREPHLREFASRFDVVVFVSGRKSSNGRSLYEVCRGANPRSYFIEDESELEHGWFTNIESVGVCGATSTPRWLMGRVAEKIRTDHSGPQ